MSPTPYWSDDRCSLYLGDCREIVPQLVAEGVRADCVVADPPYGETSLAWDRWPEGWLEFAALITDSLWCFGSLRMFGEHWPEFAGYGWKLSHDVIWRKPHGTSRVADRFKRVHETAAHWYRGPWRDIYHQAPREPYYGPDQHHGHQGARETSPHMGAYAAHSWSDDGTRITPSVIEAPSMRRAIHRTEKPVRLLTPLIAYASKPGGLVVDLFAGSASTLEAARCSGIRSIGVEADEQACELAARRLSQMDLFGGEVA